MSDRPSTQIRLDRLSVVFRSGGVLARGDTAALRDVSLTMPRGGTLGLVGESGSGKSTLGNVLVGLVKPTSGSVMVGDEPLGRQAPGFRQLVGQNPRWTLNPVLPVWRSVAEPLAIAGSPRRTRRDESVRMLRAVGLPDQLAQRYPHELSGGQVQRAAIARALVSRPELVVFDEAVSALDVSVQVHTINIIKELQAQRAFNALFISHDLASVRYAADTVAVLYRGMLMHVAPADTFYDQACHPYSLALRSAGTGDETVSLREAPDGSADGGGTDAEGCPLAGRCPFVVSRCTAERPVLREVNGQRTACHRAEDLAAATDPSGLVTRDAVRPAADEPRPDQGDR